MLPQKITVDELWVSPIANGVAIERIPAGENPSTAAKHSVLPVNVVDMPQCRKRRFVGSVRISP